MSAAAVKRGNKRIRQRTADSSDEEDGTVDLTVVSILKEDQKARGRKAGVDAEELIRAAAEAARKKAAAEAAAEAQEEPVGLQKQDAAVKVDNLLKGSFTGSTGVVESGSAEDKYMMEYVNKRMGLIGDEGGDLDATKSPQAQRTGEEKDDMPTLHGAPMPWNTGIAEVELPSEFKLRNIEATEAARKQHMEALIAREGERPVVDGGNFTANYNVHRREYAMSHRVGRGGGPGGPSGGPRGGGRGGAGGPARSSDDMTVDRFRKQSAGRRH